MTACTIDRRKIYYVNIYCALVYGTENIHRNQRIVYRGRYMLTRWLSNMFYNCVEYIYQATSPEGNIIMILYWKFNNEYTWSHTLTTIDEAYSFAYRTGLTTHPDIIEVVLVDGDKQTIIFRKTA